MAFVKQGMFANVPNIRTNMWDMFNTTESIEHVHHTKCITFLGLCVGKMWA